MNKAKMDILIFLYKDTYVGGAENVLKQISQYYLNKEQNVHVWFLRSKEFGHWEGNEKGLNLYYGGGLCKLLINIIKIRKFRFDYSYTSVVDFTGVLGLMRRLKIVKIDKMIGRESTSIFDRYSGLGLLRKKTMYKLGYPAVDVLICQTSYMKNELLKHLPWIEKRSKVLVLPNPVDLPKMKSKGNEKINPDTCRSFIITAGRFIYEKGYDVLIKAYQKLHKNYPELELIILGDGELREELEELTMKLKLQDIVKFPGFCKNVYPWFKAAKLCVVSSKVEGFPNVLLQMMSQNERVVSTLCAGDIDMIKGIHTCNPNSIDGLYEAMVSALEQTDVERNRYLFDEELKRRSINSYVDAIEKASALS